MSKSKLKLSDFHPLWVVVGGGTVNLTLAPGLGL